jgi:hypothetical protein
MKLRERSNLFLGRYEHTKVLEEIRDVIEENEEYYAVIKELKSELEYGKQRENKLMYFLYLMQQKDLPVYELFEDHIKELPTLRFSSHLNEEYKTIFMEQ